MPQTAEILYCCIVHLNVYDCLFQYILENSAETRKSNSGQRYVKKALAFSHLNPMDLASPI